MIKGLTIESSFDTLGAKLERASRSSGTGVIFINANGTEEKLLYKDLYQNALLVLGSLQGKGLKKGNQVIIQLDDSKWFITTFWACILGGFVPIPLSTGVQLEQKRKIFKIWKHLTNAFLICERSTLNGAEVPPDLSLENAEIQQRTIIKEALFDSDMSGTLYQALNRDIAYIQYSSGSTGDPKGVCLTHKNLLSNIDDIIKSLEITENDTLISWMPLTHDMGLIGFHLTGVVMNVNSICIPTSAFIRRPLVWMDKTSQHKASVLYSPNFGIKYFLSAFEKQPQHNWDLTSVRIIVNGAELIAEKMCNGFVHQLKMFGLRENAFVTAYGLAEASVEVSVMPVNSPIISFFLNRKFLGIEDTIKIVDQKDKSAVDFVDVGFPVAGCELRISGNHDQILPENTIGHIQIKGDNVTSGYYRNKEATSKIFTSDGWLKTGDLGFLRNGRLTVTGRLKNIILINGQNFYPQDIERVITAAGIVEDGKVVACGINEDGQEDLFIFILHKNDLLKFKTIVNSIQNTVFNHIGIYAKHIIPVKKIPKTTSGKIQHFLLKTDYLDGKFNHLLDLYSSTENGSTHADNLGRVAEILTNIISNLFGHQSINNSTSFFEMGMNSLMAIQMTGLLKKKLRVELSVETIFVYDSIDRLSVHIYSSNQKLNGDKLFNTEQSIVKPLDAKGHHIISSAQRRLWLLYCIDKTSSTYNESAQYEICGELDVDVVRKSFGCIIKSQWSLRTNFVEVGDQPKQVISNYEENKMNFMFDDLSNCVDTMSVYTDKAQGLINQYFDLSKDSLYRIYLAKLSRNTYRLLMVMHHIITDDFSRELLIRDFITNYDGLKGGNKFQSGNLPFQYIDYAKFLIGEDQIVRANHNLTYWLKVHQFNRQTLNLPLDFKRPLIKGGQGSSLIIKIDGDLTQGLQEYCKEQNATIFMLLVSAVYILLSRYSAQNDINVGIPVADRDDADYRDLLGFFVNIMPLRISVPRDTTLKELLNQVKLLSLKGYEHASFPFDELVNELQINRDLSRSPLFDVLISSINTSTDKWLNKSIELKKISQPSIAAKYDLAFYFQHENEALSLIIEYDIKLFSHDRIQRIEGHFNQILKSFLVDDHLAISAVDYLSAGEKFQLLQVFNEPESSDLNGSGLNIIQLFEEQVLKQPQATAIVFEEKSWTYEQIDILSTQISQYLLEICLIKPNDFIALLLDRSEMMVISILAIWKSGATYLPLDPDYPEDRVSFILASTGVPVVLINKSFVEKWKPSIERSSVYGLIIDELYPIKNEIPTRQNVELADLAYLMFTSGTSGVPKGVEIRHSSVLNVLKSLSKSPGIGKQDTCLAISNYAFDISVAELFLPLVFGAKLVIASREQILNFQLFKKLFDASHPTYMQATPSMWNMLIDSGWTGNDDLVAITCGESLTQTLKSKILKRVRKLWNLYGPTETTIFSTGIEVKPDDPLITIGLPLLNTKVFILDELQSLVPEGNFGEICIGGKGLARGYFQQESLSNEKFVANKYEDSYKVYRTGDIGRWLPNGTLELIGRSDDQIKLRGFRIELNEIENLITSLSIVLSAAVVLGNDDSGDEQLVAYLVFVNQTEDGVNQVKNYLSRKLPSYMMPANIIELSSLPLNISGKVDKKLLKTQPLGSNSYSNNIYKAPSSEMEYKLVAIWENILGRSGISITDNFFEIGGHSLKGTRLMNHIYKEWGIQIKFSEMFFYATVEKQSELIKSKLDARYIYIDLN